MSKNTIKSKDNYERKYLKIIYLIKHLSLEYIKKHLQLNDKSQPNFYMSKESDL